MNTTMNLDRFPVVDDILSQFQQIDSKHYFQIISFYEQNFEDLQYISDKEYAEILFYYCKALFETSAYERFLFHIDELIELTIVENIYTIGTYNVYYEALFDKAAVYYNLKETDKAYQILEQLLKMNNNDHYVRYLIGRIERDRVKTHIRAYRGAAIICFIGSALVIMSEMIVSTFYEFDNISMFNITRNTLFIAAFVILLIGEAFVRFKAYMAIESKLKK